MAIDSPSFCMHATVTKGWGNTPIADMSMPYCNITYIDGADMKDALSGYLEVLYGQDAASVGGSLPGDDFYYIP